MLNQMQPAENISEEIYQLAESQYVGTPLRIYQSSKILQAIAIIALLIIFCLSLFIIWSALDRGAFLLGLGCFLFLFISAALIFNYRENRSRLYLCSQGLLSIDSKKQERICWDEIQKTYDRGSGIQILTSTGGKTFVIPNNLSLGRLAELSAIIEGKVKEARVAAILAQYERGETVRFGNLEVNSYGIVDLDDAVTWELLEDIRLDKDVLSLKYESAWHDWYGIFSPKVYAPDYMYPPNLPIFLALIQHILAHKNGDLQKLHPHRDNLD